jgi:hypothetical protein
MCAVTAPHRPTLGQQASGVQAVDQPGREMAHVAPDSHPIEHERPEDWGWHGETGKWGRIGGTIAVLVTLTLLIGNHEGKVEDLWILGIALVMIIILFRDARHRKNAWRSR